MKFYCRGCDRKKKSNEFYRSKSKPTGFTSRCKKCVDKSSRNWRVNHPEKHRQYEHKYRKQNPLAYLLRNCRAVAKRRGLNFNLRLIDLQQLAVVFCPVLFIRLQYGGSRCERSASVDRINSSRGYVRDNICIISDRANRIKNNGTAGEHRRIAAYMDDHSGDGQ